MLKGSARKQVISGVGIVLVILLLALGGMVIFKSLIMPMQEARATADSVRAANVLQEQQVAAYEKQQAGLSDTLSQVSLLQTRIPEKIEMDGIITSITQAATSSGVVVTGITPGTATAFTAPDGSGASGSSASTDSSSSTTSSTTQSTGNQEIPLTVTATSGDISSAVSFLDALRTTPRALGNIASTIAPGSSGTGDAASSYTVTVNLLAYTSGD